MNIDELDLNIISSIATLIVNDILDEEQEETLLETLNEKFINEISEIALNFVIGGLDAYLSEAQLRELLRKAYEIKVLASSEVDVEEKVDLLLDKPQLWRHIQILIGAVKFALESETNKNDVEENKAQTDGESGQSAESTAGGGGASGDNSGTKSSAGANGDGTYSTDDDDYSTATDFSDYSEK